MPKTDAEYSRDTYHRYKDRILADNKRPSKRWLCRCPRCDRTHKVTMYWTGRVVNFDGTPYQPRIRCASCRQLDEHPEYQTLWA